MKPKAIFVGILSSIIFVFISHAQQDDFPVLKGPYLGQKPPGMTPEIFAPGILSTQEHHEQEPIYSSDEKMLFYTSRTAEGEYVTMYMIMEKDTWSKPLGPLSISGLKVRYPCVSYDGKKLYFVYAKEIYVDREKSYNSDIYYADILSPGQFGKPNMLSSSINTDYHERHPSITKTGTLYFYSNRESGLGGADIYRSRLVDGNYIKAENIGKVVNSKYNEYNPFIASDESFIIFNSLERPETMGGNISHDLYISFRNEEDSWSKVKNMGKLINTEADEFKATVSPDNKYLFFSSSRSGNGDIYWVDAKIIEELRPDE